MKTILIVIVTTVVAVSAPAKELNENWMRVLQTLYDLSSSDELIRKLQAMASSKDEVQQADAAYLVGEVYSRYPRIELVTVLIDLMKSKKAAVRYEAVATSASLTKHLRMLLPSIDALVDDPDPTVRRIARHEKTNIVAMLRQDSKAPPK